MLTHIRQHDTLRTELQGRVHPHTPDVVSFDGIQYATVHQRWTRAKIREDYGHQYNATEFGPKCPQPEHLNNTSDYGPDIPFPECGIDEFDCLNLNVTTPKDPQEKLPVMIWIHGGSLLNGANSDSIWDANRLVQWSISAGRPIIIVSVNYRLGPFGFFQPPSDLAVDDEMAAGNFGFHDQLLALQWVQHHISGFGGDPNRVTLAGESAGGTSVHAQIAYQEGRGRQRLFQRAIMQSGNLGVMGVWSPDRLRELWDAAVIDAGLSGGPTKAVAAMRDMDPIKLGKLPTLDISGFGVFSDGFFVNSPILTPAGGFLHHQPSLDAVMHGDNANEGNFFRSVSSEIRTLENMERIGVAVLGDQGLNKLLELYELSNWRSLDDKQRAERFNAFPEDARFFFPTNELQAAWPNSALYHFTATSPFKTSAFPDDSFHTLELLHLFGNFDGHLQAEGLEDHLRLSEDIRTVWIDFIYGGEPWLGAFSGASATIGIKGTTYSSAGEARAWTPERRARLESLQSLGYAKVVEVATRVFP